MEYLTNMADSGTIGYCWNFDESIVELHNIPTVIADETVDRNIKGFDVYKVRNWDGEDAQSISEETIENAQMFLNLLQSGITDPDISPGVDGSIGLLWDFNGIYIYIDIKSDGRVHYYFQVDQGESTEEVIQAPFNQNELYKKFENVFAVLAERENYNNILSTSFQEITTSATEYFKAA